jgi:hypothetical protein
MASAAMETIGHRGRAFMPDSSSEREEPFYNNTAELVGIVAGGAARLPRRAAAVLDPG